MTTSSRACVALLHVAFLTGLHAQTPRAATMLKMALYQQTSATAPTTLGFAVGAQVEFAGATPATLSVTLTKPNGTQVLPRSSATGFSILDAFLSRAAMDSQFPDGAYSVRVSSLPNISYPMVVTSPATHTAPTIANFTAAQAIASPANFTLSWAPLEGANASDVLALTVRSADGAYSYSSPAAGQAGALSGTATQITLNLPPNQQFSGDLMYIRVSDLGVSGTTGIVSGFAVATRFTMRTLSGMPAPIMSQHPASRAAAVNESTTFTASAAGSGPFTYQWKLNGAEVSNATNASLTLPNVQAFQAGNYTVEARSPGGAVTSDIATLSVTPVSTAGSNARLVNLATRGQAGTDANALIPGFVLSGTGTMRVLIRAVGPTLTQFGLAAADVVADPTITLVSTTTGATVATNDDWEQGDPSAITSATSAAGGFALPAGSRDAALLTTLGPGSYTALVSGKGAAVGLAIVEVYDLDGAASTLRLVNIATRGLVGRDNRVLIPGFVVSGTTSKTYLIRGVGPTLALFNQPGILADPVLTVFQGSSELFTNDDWASNSNASQVAAAAQSAGAFALVANSRDAAMLVTLQPGAYTFQVAGKGTATGVALVEVYEVP